MKKQQTTKKLESREGYIEKSIDIKKRVNAARKMQLKRTSL